MSAERNIFDNQIIPVFRSYLKEGDNILDIGKSNDDLSTYYKNMFPNMIYKTSDIEGAKNPDITDDMENTKIPENSFDGIICFGVWEMCNYSPFDLYKGMMKILKTNGYFLFGIKLTGYPVEWNYDWFRFTPNGAKRLLKDCKILYEHTAERNDSAAYYFVVGQKIL